jgi:LysR family transcriptional regulator, nitrogen assimilation regulatory protein
MDLKQLRIFLKVARTGSLSRASDELRLAQSALSRQIRLLEDRIGQPLFTRLPRGMELTEAGKELQARTAGLLDQLEKTLDEVGAFSSVPSGHVALGMVPTVSYLLAARIARRVVRDYPAVTLHIREGYTGHLIQWLNSGELDATLLYGSQADNHLRTVFGVREDLLLAGAMGDPDFPKEPVPVRDLARFTLILPSKPHGLRGVVEDAARKAGIGLNVAFEADSARLLKELVEDGMGYTILPVSAFSRASDVGRYALMPLCKPNVARHISLALPVNRTETVATRAVAQIVADEMRLAITGGRWQAVGSGDGK